MASMKQVMMMPKASVLRWSARADCRVGDQKNVKTYIEPSKQQDVKPIVRSRLRAAVHGRVLSCGS